MEVLVTRVFYFQATQEELKASYRRLCMLYHPDKHRDPELKRQAEQLFNLVHQAYEGERWCCVIIRLTRVSSVTQSLKHTGSIWVFIFLCSGAIFAICPAVLLLFCFILFSTTVEQPCCDFISLSVQF